MSYITNDNIKELVTSYFGNNDLPADLVDDGAPVPIGQWDVSQVTNMDELFDDMAGLDENIGTWNVSNVTSMVSMFGNNGLFNQPIGQWNVSNVSNMTGMFLGCESFNQPIGQWNVSNVTDMNNMFAGAKAFNQPIGQWDVSNVTDTDNMFDDAYVFNQPIGQWDVSNVTNMNRMFNEARVFNQPIDEWDVSNVADMGGMFHNAAAFNQPIGRWNVSNVTAMNHMFHNAAAFNQPIGRWNVSNVSDMDNMFQNAAAFNQPIERWNVTRAVAEGNMSDMFDDAESFSQPLFAWNVLRPTIISMFPNVAQRRNYLERVRSNVRVARTTEEYMSMCRSADKTDDECMQAECPVCFEKFIINKNLRRPVIFHKSKKSVASNSQEMWSCPVHAVEQMQSGKINVCASCRAVLSIPQLDIDNIMNPEFEVPYDRAARAVQLQSVIRGHQTRRSSVGKAVTKKVRREQEYRESRKAFHDSYLKDHPQNGGKKNKKHFRKVKTLGKTRRNRK